MDDRWTPESAEDLAAEEGIALSEKHWRVIAGARELIAASQRVPSIAEVSEKCGLALRELKQLFPGAAEDLLARLAGAPELERKGTS